MLNNLHRITDAAKTARHPPQASPPGNEEWSKNQDGDEPYPRCHQRYFRTVVNDGEKNADTPQDLDPQRQGEGQ